MFFLKDERDTSVIFWLSIIFISFFALIKISFCPEAPRMVIHFSYKGNKNIALEEIRDLLLNRGYVIKEYAPFDGLLFTEYKFHDWGTGERLLALVVHIDDKITLTGMGKMAIPVANVGDSKSILKIQFG